jgi:hypothetical protein
MSIKVMVSNIASSVNGRESIIDIDISFQCIIAVDRSEKNIDTYSNNPASLALLKMYIDAMMNDIPEIMVMNACRA